MMTEKQAALVILLSTIVQQQIDPANPVKRLLKAMTDETCEELEQFGVRAPDISECFAEFARRFGVAPSP